MFFVCHAWSACAWGHSSNKYCVRLYGSILVKVDVIVAVSVGSGDGDGYQRTEKYSTTSPV